MNLSPEQTQQLREMLDVFTTDALYTLLLGLDGSAALGVTSATTPCWTRTVR